MISDIRSVFDVPSVMSFNADWTGMCAAVFRNGALPASVPDAFAYMLAVPQLTT